LRETTQSLAIMMVNCIWQDKYSAGRCN